MMRKVLALLVGTVLVDAVLFSVHLSGRPLPQKSRNDSLAEGPPFTLDQVLLMADPDYPEPGFIDLIRKRRVAFTLNEQIERQLREKNISPGKLEALRKAQPEPRPSSTPPTPEKPTAGPLTVRCSPPECEVSANGGPYYKTRLGSWTFPDLPVGDAYVDFKREDPSYEGQQRLVRLQAGRDLAISVTLEPAFPTQRMFGEKIFDRMVEVLGGEAGLRQVSSLTVGGEVRFVDREGRRLLDGTIDLKLILPDLLSMKVDSSSAVKFSIVVKRGAKSRPKGKPPTDVEDYANLLRDAQLAAIVRDIQKRRSTMDILAKAPDRVDMLRAADRIGTYAIALGENLEPVDIQYASVAGSGSKTSYSQYETVGKARYPKRMLLKLDPERKDALELHLVGVEPSPKLSERDLRK